MGSNFIRIILTPILPLSIAAPASAEWPAAVERRLTRSYTHCMANGAAGRGQTLAMNNCTSAEIARQDARLNQVYKAVMKRLGPKRKAALRTSERQWVARRDRTCRTAAEAFGDGSGAGLEHGQCILRETIARTIWLENHR